jgi:hypothetical protein
VGEERRWDFEGNGFDDIGIAQVIGRIKICDGCSFLILQPGRKRLAMSRVQ